MASHTIPLSELSVCGPVIGQKIDGPAESAPDLGYWALSGERDILHSHHNCALITSGSSEARGARLRTFERTVRRDGVNQLGHK